jgi:hypothetical protein
LIRAIEKGKLIATRGENNIYQIDSEELARVYTMSPPGRVASQHDYKTELAVLRAVLEVVKQERDSWKAQAMLLAGDRR